MQTRNRPSDTAEQLVDVLDTVEIRRNPFATVTGADECGAPIGGGIPAECENAF
jgi:hypothetical protein